jgi:hypothetical protein
VSSCCSCNRIKKPRKSRDRNRGNSDHGYKNENNRKKTVVHFTPEELAELQREAQKGRRSRKLKRLLRSGKVFPSINTKNKEGVN